VEGTVSVTGRPRLAEVVRWAARVIGLGGTLFYLMLLFAAWESPGFFNTFYIHSTVGIFLAATAVIALAGCIISWWRLRLAGVLLIISLPYAIKLYSKRSFYHFLVNDAMGQEIKLEKYKGNVLLVVNVATECGYTPQFIQLQQIYEKYKDRGFDVRAFPSDSFHQEPRSAQEVLTFCNDTYLVNFPILEKIHVKGKYQAPLYAFLTEEKTNPDYPGPIQWNFEKFLIGRKGEILARFSSEKVPDDPEVIHAIKKALDTG